LEGALCFCQAQGRVVVRVQVGEDQVPGTGSGGMPAGLPAGQVQTRGKTWLIGEPCLAQQDVRGPGQLDKYRGFAGVAGVGEHLPAVLEPERERLHGMGDVPGPRSDGEPLTCPPQWDETRGSPG